MLRARKTVLSVFGSIFVSLIVAPAASASDHVQRVDMRLDQGNAAPGVPVAIRGQGQERRLLREKPSKQHLIVKKRSRVTGTAQRQKKPELASDMLVIVGVDAKGTEIGRQPISDPRVVRAETFSLSGAIETSELLYQTDAEFAVFLPDNPALSAVRVYQPNWNGRSFDLELVGEAAVP